MSSACYRIAWGLLLVLINVRVGGLDLLPDPLGYLLAASGLWTLSERSRFFQAGGAAALLLLIGSIARMIVGEPGTGFLNGLPPTILELSLRLLDMLLSTLLIYGICKGIMSSFSGESSLNIAGRARVCLGWFMTVQGLWLASYPFTHFERRPGYHGLLFVHFDHSRHDFPSCGAVDAEGGRKIMAGDGGREITP